MEIESARCECCGLNEECTNEYIRNVKANFGGKWLCGLCSEAVRDEVLKGKKKGENALEEAVSEHISVYHVFKSNPAISVAQGMRQMLKKRSTSKT